MINLDAEKVNWKNWEKSGVREQIKLVAGAAKKYLSEGLAEKSRLSFQQKASEEEDGGVLLSIFYSLQALFSAHTLALPDLFSFLLFFVLVWLSSVNLFF